MPDNKSTLKPDLIKILIDKLLIGILLVIAGIFSTNFIEKLKSERSFSAELAKIRAAKIAEVWEKVYLYEAAAEAQEAAQREIIMRGGEKVLELARKASVHPSSSPKNVKDVNEEVQNEIPEVPKLKEAEELANTLNRNRFWLGEDVYSKIESFLDAREAYNMAVAWNDENKIKDATKKREESRDSISKIREMLLKE